MEDRVVLHIYKTLLQNPFEAFWQPQTPHPKFIPHLSSFHIALLFSLVFSSFWSTLCLLSVPGFSKWHFLRLFAHRFYLSASFIFILVYHCAGTLSNSYKMQIWSRSLMKNLQWLYIDLGWNCQTPHLFVLWTLLNFLIMLTPLINFVIAQVSLLWHSSLSLMGLHMLLCA